MNTQLNLRSQRARKARLAHSFGSGGSAVLRLVSAVFTGAALYCLTIGQLPRLGYASASLACLCLTLLLWYRYDLTALPALIPAKQLDDVLDPKLLARLKDPVTPRTLWDLSLTQYTGQFVCSRLYISAKGIADAMSTDQARTAAIWHKVVELQAGRQSKDIHAGVLTAALLLATPELQPFLTRCKLDTSDIIEVLHWCDRRLGYARAARPYYGGIGRDWATGFTPGLEQYGANISAGIERGGGIVHAMAHQSLIPGIANSLAQGSAVALVGPEGVGKTTLVDGLAHYLLEGKQPQLQYYQIVSLHASVILSNSGQQLENTLLRLFGEAMAAGNIILFLDDAHMFFGKGLGAFDMSQLLMPVLRSRNIQLIAAFTPSEWQQLHTQQPALTTSFASVTVGEPPAPVVMQAAEDMALLTERRHGAFITYDAIREAYRLSGQFVQEGAYPGKTVHLLEQAMAYADKDGLVTAEVVQGTIEKTRGVRVSGAQAPEADMLLHLEDRIHQRMIGQTRAVQVVASALRRGRAGVTNPKRPLGSFLFLGPTGVGKTELARSLAATYFGDEKQMIRLDMSEYQQPGDVARLLETGNQTTQSLLMAVRQQPFSVVLLDEIEKAHPNILNLMLQLLDEGQLTDQQGRPASFRSSIIIATSNAGAHDISERVQAGQPLQGFERPLLDKLIGAGQFKSELINRFDEVVLFSPLGKPELAQVAELMLREVNRTLAPQHINVQLTPEALQQLVQAGYDPQFGARPMRRMIQKTVENAVAVKILEGSAAAGSTITLDVADLTLQQ